MVLIAPHRGKQKGSVSQPGISTVAFVNWQRAVHEVDSSPKVLLKHICTKRKIVYWKEKGIPLFSWVQEYALGKLVPQPESLI